MSRPPIDATSPTVRLHMKVPQSFLDRVSEYQFANRIPSKSEAIRRLVDEALDAREPS